jgi:tetraacyldisaccharide 4'-kinase
MSASQNADAESATEARDSPSKIQNPKSKMLASLAAGFRMGVALRGAAYRRGWLKTRRLSSKVVSVGNLTAGGTGKTPLVECLAKSLLKHGRKPAILTRGYGRRDGVPILVLEPGPGRVVNPREAGDEPALLARALHAVPIVVGADRYQAGCLAEDRFDVDVLLLDDGFQHLALARDLDVVLLDATERLSGMLPAGRQREPCSALQRAHLVVLTRVELGDPGPIEEQVCRINPRAQIFHSRTKLSELVDLRNGNTYPPGAFHGERVYAFCGIGNPQAFFRDLSAWGFCVVAEDSFRDHHVYDAKDVTEVFKRFQKSGATALVTTEKDALNLPPISEGAIGLGRPTGLSGDAPVFAAAIQTELLEERAFEQALLAAL